MKYLHWLNQLPNSYDHRKLRLELLCRLQFFTTAAFSPLFFHRHNRVNCSTDPILKANNMQFAHYVVFIATTIALLALSGSLSVDAAGSVTQSLTASSITAKVEMLAKIYRTDPANLQIFKMVPKLSHP